MCQLLARGFQHIPCNWCCLWAHLIFIQCTNVQSSRSRLLPFLFHIHTHSHLNPFLQFFFSAFFFLSAQKIIRIPHPNMSVVQFICVHIFALNRFISFENFCRRCVVYSEKYANRCTYLFDAVYWIYNCRIRAMNICRN